jgi:hypothetical protein
MELATSRSSRETDLTGCFHFGGVRQHALPAGSIRIVQPSTIKTAQDPQRFIAHLGAQMKIQGVRAHLCTVRVPVTEPTSHKQQRTRTPLSLFIIIILHSPLPLLYRRINYITRIQLQWHYQKLGSISLLAGAVALFLF